MSRSDTIDFFSLYKLPYIIQELSHLKRRPAIPSLISSDKETLWLPVSIQTQVVYGLKRNLLIAHTSCVLPEYNVDLLAPFLNICHQKGDSKRKNKPVIADIFCYLVMLTWSDPDPQVSTSYYPDLYNIRNGILSDQQIEYPVSVHFHKY